MDWFLYFIVILAVVLLLVLIVGFAISYSINSHFVISDGEQIQIQDTSSGLYWGVTNNQVVLSTTPVTYTVQGGSNNYFRLMGPTGTSVSSAGTHLIYAVNGTPLAVNFDKSVDGTNLNTGKIFLVDNPNISNYVRVTNDFLLINGTVNDAATFAFFKVG